MHDKNAYEGQKEKSKTQGFKKTNGHERRKKGQVRELCYVRRVQRKIVLAGGYCGQKRVEVRS